MTDQEREIQRVISYIRSCRDAGIDTTITIDKTRNHFILNALEEIQQYRVIGTVEECRRAMEKQKAKKVIDDTAFGMCPNCRNEFNSELVNEYNMKYCIYCGQAIDLRSTYKPKIIEGKISGTGWPIDGHTLVLTLWDWDNYESWHLYGWMPEDEQAIMETMFITETEAGMCMSNTLEEYAEYWKEWEPEGSFCIPLENVEVLKVLQEEQKENKNADTANQKEMV